MRTWIVENPGLTLLYAALIVALGVFLYRRMNSTNKRVIVDYEPSAQPTIPVTSTTTIIGRPGPAGMTGSAPTGGMVAGARVSASGNAR